MAPIPLVRLYPSAQNVVWVSGRASVEQEDRGVRVAAAFDHQEGTLLGIRIEIENRTDARLEVDPADVTFTTCAPRATTSCAPARQVVNPERVLDDLDQKQSREAAAAVNDEVFLGTLVLLSAVGDVASAAGGGHGHHSGRSPTLQIAGDMDATAAGHESAMQSMAAQRETWANVALRRTTLFPTGGLAGLVYVPTDLAAKFVWVQVRTADRTFPFCFAQTVVSINASGVAPRPASGPVRGVPSH